MKGRFLLSLAWKNLTRYKRRTFITVIVLAVGIACFILLDSILIGSRMESELNLQRYEIGMAKLVTPLFWEDRKELPLKPSIENTNEVLNRLKEEGIQATARTRFQSNITIDSGIGGTFPSVVTGIDMKQDDQVFRIFESVDRGRIPEPNEDTLLLGSWMAEDLGLEIGDLMTLQIIDRAGGNDALEVEIVGLVDSPNPIVNLTGVYLPLRSLDYYLYMQGTVTEIVLAWPAGMSEKQGLEVASVVAEDFGLELHPWQDWAKEYIAASEGDKYGSAIILMMIFIIAAVGFSNTLLMSLLERVPETGMMRAMGCTRREMRRLYMTESLILGVMGSVLGIFIGAVLNIPIVLKGIDITPMMRDMGNVGYRFTGIMYGVWAPSSYIASFISGVIIALSVSVVSIHKALRMKITDSVQAA